MIKNIKIAIIIFIIFWCCLFIGGKIKEFINKMFLDTVKIENVIKNQNQFFA
jgi:hypothetical protein